MKSERGLSEEDYRKPNGRKHDSLPDYGGSDPRTSRSGPLYQQWIERKDGLCFGGCGARSRLVGRPGGWPGGSWTAGGGGGSSGGVLGGHGLGTGGGFCSG